jgi:hypothetical protein
MNREGKVVKELVKNIEVFMQKNAKGIIRLSGTLHKLEIFAVDPVPIISLAKLLDKEANDIVEKPDQTVDRLTLPLILGKLIPKDTIKEVYINKMDPLTKLIFAEVTANEKKILVVPTAGIFLAKAINIPLYMDTEICETLERLKKQYDSSVAA